jgi:hypothetical protein
MKKPVLEYMLQEYDNDRKKPERITKKTPELKYPHRRLFGVLEYEYKQIIGGAKMMLALQGSGKWRVAGRGRFQVAKKK